MLSAFPDNDAELCWKRRVDWTVVSAAIGVSKEIGRLLEKCCAIDWFGESRL